MSAGCDDCRPKDLTHTTPAYRKALWLVALLNVGMGAAEILGGLFARSQALKADALDFLGDGAITFLGLAALHRSRHWRAGSAVLQACFLGLMAAGVLAATVYRIFIQEIPEADTMGIFAVAALAVNVGAALILIPHRKGDASVRAVWLFSRNDALGNAAVLVAAAFVAWTHTPWPDLLVAAVIAGLFLHSAWEIFTGAWRELQEGKPAAAL
jgi:cation diffusion facilitator family transporter